MPMEEAARVGDIFVTVTGNKSVIRREHFESMKDGAIVANSGNFNVEIDIPALESLATSTRKAREFVDEYVLADSRKVYVLGEGRLINLAAAEGHPASVMDMSFANQALAAEYLVAEYKNLPNNVFPVPEHLDKRVAKLKLDAMEIGIDTLTPEQEAYLAGWSEAPKQRTAMILKKPRPPRRGFLLSPHVRPPCDMSRQGGSLPSHPGILSS